MFQLGEYASLVLISVLGSLIFLGGWHGLGLFDDELARRRAGRADVRKDLAFIIFFMWMRASLPRLRIDQLMAFCWQILLPFCFLQIIINGLVLVYDWPE